jgi:PIN domain nuclease of toxin-antitoxin system
MTTVRYLADTHIILWSVSDDERLKTRYREILASEATVFASAASVWEIAIKRASGKLRAPANLAALLPRMRFSPLHVTLRHAEATAHLPATHGDPFDRLLIAQAQEEGLTLLSEDRTFASYNISVV